MGEAEVKCLLRHLPPKKEKIFSGRKGGRKRRLEKLSVQRKRTQRNTSANLGGEPKRTMPMERRPEKKVRDERDVTSNLCLIDGHGSTREGRRWSNENQIQVSSSGEREQSCRRETKEE